MSDRKTFTLIAAAAFALPITLGATAPAAADDDEERPLWEPEPTAAFADVDVEAIADDGRDRWAIRDIQRQWNDGVRDGNELDVRVAEDRLMRWLEAEAAEDRAEVAAEERELALARAMDDATRVAVERMELMRARADLTQTERTLEQLRGLALAQEEGRANGAHAHATGDLIGRAVRMAEDEVAMTREEAREDREAYLDTLRTRGSYDRGV